VPAISRKYAVSDETIRCRLFARTLPVLSCHQDVSDTGNDLASAWIAGCGVLQQGSSSEAEVLPPERKQFRHEHIRSEFM